jgi:hypothetical protein
MATPAPDLVPDEVAHHRTRERERRREPQAEVAGPGQGASTEENGLSRHRWHKLFHEHAAKEGRIAVRANEDFQAFHSGSPQVPYFYRPAAPEASRLSTNPQSPR